MADLALRPLSLGELLDRAFTIFRRRFGAIMIVLLASLIAPGLLVMKDLGTFLQLSQLDGGPTTPEAQFAMVAGLMGKMMVIMLVAAIGMLVGRTALGWITHRTILGEEAEVGDSFSEAFRLFFPMLGLLFIEVVIIIVVEILLYIPFFIFGFGAAMGGVTPGAGFGIGIFAWFIAYFIAILYLFSTLFVTTSVLIVEPGMTVFRALERSWQLTQGRRWNIVGTLLLIYVLAWVAMVGVSIAVGVVMGLAQRGTESMGGVMFGLFGGIMLLGLLVAGYYYVLQMVTYYDLRVRKEGLDLELASAAMADA